VLAFLGAFASGKAGMATNNIELANICDRLRKQVEIILADLPSLRGQADPNDPLASHLIDRLLVATDCATGCMILTGHNLPAPLASAARSICENLLRATGPP
jgi:hypothetical protein